MENVKQKAWTTLEELGIKKLPINVEEVLVNHFGYTVIPYSAATEYTKEMSLHDATNMYKAFTVAKDKTVLYNDTLSYGERNEVLGHELGHVVLGHTSHKGLLGKSANPYQENLQEDEADKFAISFVAPAPLLMKKKATSIVDVARETGLPTKKAREAWAQLLCEEDYVKHKPNKRRTIIILICLFIVFASAGAWLHSEVEDSVDYAVHTQTEARTVYVTATGTRYHKQDCQYVKGKDNLTEMTLAEAEEDMLTPCKVCTPDEE